MDLAFFEIEDQHAKLHVRGVERDKFTRVQKRGGEITGIPSDRANLLELIAALDASIIDDETLVDGANRIGGLIRTSDECYSPGRETAVERRGRFLASWRRDDPTSSSGQFERRFRRL